MSFSTCTDHQSILDVISKFEVVSHNKTFLDFVVRGYPYLLVGDQHKAIRNPSRGVTATS